MNSKNLKTGYIKTYHSILENQLYPFNQNRKFTSFEAMFDLLLQAHHKLEPRTVRDVMIKRGQIAITQRQLAERWKWNLETVNRFLKELKQDNLTSGSGEKTAFLSIKTERWFSVITIVNYDFYNPICKQKSVQKTERKTEQKSEHLIMNINNNINSNELILDDRSHQSISEEKNFGNPEINKMLLALKGKIQISAFADSAIERNIAKHCVNLLSKIGKDEFVRRLESILSDSFKRKNCNRIRYVYNEIKAFMEPQESDEIVSITTK